MRKIWHNVLIKKCLAFFRSGGLLVMEEAWLLSLVVLEGVHSRDLSFLHNDYINYIYQIGSFNIQDVFYLLFTLLLYRELVLCFYIRDFSFMLNWTSFDS